MRKSNIRIFKFLQNSIYGPKSQSYSILVILEEWESKQARQDVSEVIWSLENLRPWKKSRKGLRL